MTSLDFGFLAGGPPVAVLGLGRSGIATALALQASGVRVAAWDDSPAGRASAEGQGISMVDLSAIDFTDIRVLVQAPGIPHTFPEPHPVSVRARAANCPIIGDIELLYLAQPDARFVGITGTNGKSTTTALIGHIVTEAGLPVAVGGNLGIPALTFPALGPDGVYVLEMSSYQLELIDRLVFDAAVLLNITPDHLDRHGGMDGYIAAKERIFRRQDTAGPGRNPAAIVGVDCEPCQAIAARLTAAGHQRLIRFSVGTPTSGGVWVEDGWLHDDLDGAATRAVDLKSIRRLPGAHNWQNAVAAWAVGRVLGIEPARIIAALHSFPGLVHRQQLVRTLGDISFVDDSKATNVDAAEKALAAYRRIYWIAGGRAKEGGFDALDPVLSDVVHVFLIGEAAPEMATWLRGRVPVVDCGTMGAAVQAAFARAAADGEGGVVLLSPACASFDQYPNFEVRGRDFVAHVLALPEVQAEVQA